MARSVNYRYDPDEVEKWHAAAKAKGQTFREWVRRALHQVADEQLDEAAEAERRRRSR